MRATSLSGYRLTAAFVILGLGCTRSSTAAGTPAKGQSPAAPASRTRPVPVPIGSAPIQVSAEHDAFTAHAGQCAVDVTLAKLSGTARPAAAEQVNARLRETALAGIPAECRGGHDAAPVRANSLCGDLPERGKTDVVIAYLVGMSEGNVLSVRLDTTVCRNPSLHPDESRRGLTVDLRTAQVVPLEGLFAANTDWRRRLADTVARELRQKKLKAESPGAVPTNYYLKREGLVLLGVLSAHAFASLEITVPFAGIRDLLAKDGVLGALAAPASKQPINGN